MKKILISSVIAVTMLSSCGTYTGAGAANGAYFGSILGSAIGGINDGYRGSNIGTIIGMAGGAALGAAIGNAADQRRQDDLYQYNAEKARLAAKRSARRQQQTDQGYALPDKDSGSGTYGDSGFNPENSADDRFDIDFGNGADEGYGVDNSSRQDARLVLRNARFVDSDGDNVISRGEQCDIIFEIYNSGAGTAYNVEPTVKELTGNKHILVSPSILVESLAGHKGVKYTARVVADRMLKNGTARFSVSVLMDGNEVAEPVILTVKTAR